MEGKELQRGIEQDTGSMKGKWKKQGVTLTEEGKGW